MLRFFAQSALTLLGNVIGLAVASWLLPDFRITSTGFALSVVFFTVAQILLAPFILKMAVKYAPVLRGGIALVTIFIVLVLTANFTDGLAISGVTTWVTAPLIIWVTTVVAGILLPLVLFKKVLTKAQTNA